MIAGVVAVVLGLGVLIYPFMASRVEEREAECARLCADKGFNGYRYSPPRGIGRLVSQDRCQCVDKKPEPK